MYLMKANAWELERTVNHVREKRPVISPNPGFLAQLRRFEKSLKPTIELKKEESAVMKFLNEEEERKTSSSFMSRSVMRQTTASKSSTMRNLSTQKPSLLDKTKSLLRNSEARQPMRPPTLKESLGMEQLVAPRIIKHNR